MCLVCTDICICLLHRKNRKQHSSGSRWSSSQVAKGLNCSAPLIESHGGRSVGLAFLAARLTEYSKWN